MRCPNCGTENAPDSRFCGGCGMPFGAPAPQGQVPMARTAKIPDDAPIAPPTRPAQPSRGQPHVSYAPPAMPTPPPGALQQAQVPAIPPTPVTMQRQPRPQSVSPPVRPPMASNASMSYAATGSAPLGLIAFVLFIDLALAGAGALLLAKGLAKQTDQTVEKAAKP